jgi:hypothetical protein
MDESARESEKYWDARYSLSPPAVHAVKLSETRLVARGAGQFLSRAVIHCQSVFPPCRAPVPTRRRVDNPPRGI